ncbi:LysR family transcriptional regulator [Roseomonas marmotae]|uniref:LysR family transcriptional regulator n=1 Tax=Roseomonas marmotae TaxID=2768161 RepID=A0ABS3KEE5_9PROT|nr:LysR family transcriptional regulator [Roseomonas marmotae]MBO1075841.1 LysR family transcriptional regulator [Roseomonas marmotae]QTI81967.1 LysR family transcriptional regulator [Roseomonas marmotae]
MPEVEVQAPRDAARSIAWDDFRLIKAVAEARNLPAAAARLGINHSTVFRRLRQIEALLGFPLFERHRTGYAPTPAGEQMAALAARVDEDITAVTRHLAGQAPAAAGEVRIATSDALLSGLLMPMLARLRQAHPAIRLDVVTGNEALNLSRRDADIAIRATDAPPETLVGRRLGRIAWAPYGRAEDVPGGSPPLAELLAGSDWLSPGDNLSGLRAARFLRQRVPAERIAGRFDTVGGLVAGVEAGLGIAHLPCFLGDKRAALVRLAPPEPDLATDLWLLTHPDLRQTPRIRVLMDALAAGVARMQPLIEGAAPD